MRAWLWTLLVFAVAVAVAVAVRDFTGNVVIVSPPYRIEISVIFAVVLVAATFVALYVSLRLLGWGAGLAPRWRAWRLQRQMAREHQRLEQGWVRLLQGHYVKAKDDFLAVTDASKSDTRQVLAQLGVARAALALSDAAQMDRALDAARRDARRDASLLLAVSCTAADLLLTQGRPAEAAVWLTQIQESAARHVHLQRLALRTNLALGHWETALRQARSLSRHHDAQTGLDAALAQAAAGYLRSAADDNEAQAIWKRLKPAERLLPEVVLAATSVFAQQPAQLRQILQDALEVKLDPRLLVAYGQCDASEVGPRLQRAEAWLSRHPQDPDLLRTLGSLCLRGELWGPATGYLQRSLEQREDPRTHALLGTLYDHLERPQDASRHWRMATSLEADLRLAQERRSVLPVADTRGDPRHVDGGVLDLEMPVPTTARPSTERAPETELLGAADLPPRDLRDVTDVEVRPPSAARSTRG